MIARIGFTLIELSIVIVIIGLIIGSVLVGRDLIAAAEVRATVSQIEKYNTAVHTFRLKYGYLPGDIPNPTATGFGFLSRGSNAGMGDGNGMLEGTDNGGANRNCGPFIVSNENLMVWVDLSTANLIDGKFNTAIATSRPTLTSATVPDYLPAAKIGKGSYIYTMAGYCGAWPSGGLMGTGVNYFGIEGIYSSDANGHANATTSIPVDQAYNFDAKVDDGLPQAGNVTARHVHNLAGTEHVYWAGTTDETFGGFTTATPGSSATCFDNNNTASAVQQYSVGQSGGNGVNCALLIKFK